MGQQDIAQFKVTGAVETYFQNIVLDHEKNQVVKSKNV